MKIVPIPKVTRDECKRTDDKLHRNRAHVPWWRVNYTHLPESAIETLSTGRGTIQQGVKVYLIFGHSRDIFIGDNCEKLTINEFVGLVDGTGWQPLVQLGRDVEMTQ